MKNQTGIRLFIFKLEARKDEMPEGKVLIIIPQDKRDLFIYVDNVLSIQLPHLRESSIQTTNKWKRR